ncbi:MAG TPA: hypothetical protein VGD87_16260 [Archangium sp.]
MRVLLPLLLLCACGQAVPIRGTFEMGVTGPVSVGAILSAKATSATTTRVGLTDTIRSERDVTILSSAIEPADAWEQVECAECKGSVRYRALRANSGTITVTADDGLGVETFTKPVEAVMPSQVKLFVTPCETMTWQAGIDFQLYLQLLSGTRVLSDFGIGPSSFSVTGGSTLSGVPSALWVNTDAATGVGRLTSSLDPSFAASFTVFTPAEVSAIDLAPYDALNPLTFTAGRSTVARVTVSHPGAPACDDNLIRKVGTLTPDVCEVLGGATTATQSNDGGYFTTLRAKKAGTCTVTASVEGAPASMTRDFVVSERPDGGP